MKKENLNNKKLEWVTPQISRLDMEDTEGKQILNGSELTRTHFSYGPS